MSVIAFTTIEAPRKLQTIIESVMWSGWKRILRNVAVLISGHGIGLIFWWFVFGVILGYLRPWP